MTRTSNLNINLRMKSSSELSNKLSNQCAKPFFMKLTKKSFSTGSNPFNSLLPITRSIIIGNLIMYGVSFFFDPKDYITSFYYSADSLQSGKIHTAITSHFVKPGVFDVLVDSLVVGMFGNQLEAMIGTELMKRLLLFSALGSMAIVHVTSKNDEYFKLDTFIRMFVYFWAIRNPQQLVYFVPLPFKIRMAYLAGALAAIDVYNGKLCNFGPLLASLALARVKTI